VIVETTVEELPLTKKVYINFPGGNTPQQKPVPEKKAVIAEEKSVPIYEPLPEPVTFADKTNYPQRTERFSTNKNKQERSR
jgi:hypothetical protein